MPLPKKKKKKKEESDDDVELIFDDDSMELVLSGDEPTLVNASLDEEAMESDENIKEKCAICGYYGMEDSPVVECINCSMWVHEKRPKKNGLPLVTKRCSKLGKCIKCQ